MNNSNPIYLKFSDFPNTKDKAHAVVTAALEDATDYGNKNRLPIEMASALFEGLIREAILELEAAIANSPDNLGASTIHFRKRHKKPDKGSLN